MAGNFLMFLNFALNVKIGMLKHLLVIGLMSNSQLLANKEITRKEGSRFGGRSGRRHYEVIEVHLF